MYVIVTSNEKLIDCIKNNHGDVLIQPYQLDLKKYNGEKAAITNNKRIAIIAIVEGAKVYETATLCTIIPFYHSEKDVLDVLIDNLLEAINMRKTHKGYEYIKHMLKCNVKDDEYCLKPMTKTVYPECAKLFGVSAATVAKHSSDIIKNSYARNPKIYDVLFARTHHNDLKEAPKVNQFVVLMAEKIRRNLKEEQL